MLIPLVFFSRGAGRSQESPLGRTGGRGPHFIVICLFDLFEYLEFVCRGLQALGGIPFV